MTTNRYRTLLALIRTSLSDTYLALKPERNGDEEKQILLTQVQASIT